MTQTTPETPSRHLDLDGVHNFRDVGGYRARGGGRVRWRRIFRSGAFELMTAADLGQLQAVARDLHLIDLRHPDEIAAAGPHATAHSRALPGTHLPAFPVDRTQAALIEELNGLYGPGPSGQRYVHYLGIAGAGFAEAFAALATVARRPLAIHCTAGKDRTGVLVAMLLEVLGVDDDDIVADYALSDAAADRLLAYLRSTGRDPAGDEDEIRRRLGVTPDRMVDFLAGMRRRYGSSADYFASRGVDEATLETVRTALVDPDPEAPRP